MRGSAGRSRRRRVGLLHGALGAAAKEDALRAFADGRIHVLVATTVVELGIDVPNATVMMVEEADRFGLAQLHQLRGRVGRGAFAGAACCSPPTRRHRTHRGGRASGSARRWTTGFVWPRPISPRGGSAICGGRRRPGRGGDGAPGAAGLAEFAELTALGRREAEALLATDPLLADPAHAELARAARARTAMLFAGEAG